MPENVPITKIFNQLKKDAEELLNAEGFYEVLAYGWEDQDEPDPKYIGHAMWQTNPPFEPDWSALFDGNTIPISPTKEVEVLTVTGEDFIGTMTFARKSIGLALCHATSAEPASIDDQEFWYEYTTSLQWLHVASDRLRDFFIMAAFKTTTKKYEENYLKENAKRCSYSEPFEAAVQAKPLRKEYLTPLPSLAKDIQKQRRERNQIVHAVATRLAQASVSVMQRQQELAQDHQSMRALPIELEELHPAKIVNSPHAAMTGLVEMMKDRYISLIEASNLVFKFEYWERVVRHNLIVHPPAAS